MIGGRALEPLLRGGGGAEVRRGVQAWVRRRLLYPLAEVVSHTLRLWPGPARMVFVACACSLVCACSVVCSDSFNNNKKKDATCPRAFLPAAAVSLRRGARRA